VPKWILKINKRKSIMIKKILLISIISMYVQILSAGCGGCGTSRSHSSSVSNSVSKTGLLEKVPANKYVAGTVLVSCGMCNFLTSENDCSMAIKIGSDIYKVSEKNIDDHGDSHASDGYCNVIKKVYVEGNVKSNKFFPTKMEIAKL